MLTHDAIERAKATGHLTPVAPMVNWSGTVRVILMCRPVVDAISEGRATPEAGERQRWAALEATFSRFIEGGRVDANVMRQLNEPKFEHWEIKNRRPRPGMRVFGRFALPDVFVATHIKDRNGLKGMNSLEYEMEKLVCEAHWAEAGLLEPFTDSPHFRYNAYITANAHPTLRIY